MNDDGSAGFTLVPEELSSSRRFLQTQARIGPTAPQTIETVLTLMDELAALTDFYPTLQNERFKGWVDQLYALSAATDTVYGQSFPAMYVVYSYHKYFVRGDWYDTTLSPSDDFVQRNFSVSPNPPAWESTIDGLLKLWGETPPAKIIDTGLTWDGNRPPKSNWCQVKQARDDAAVFEAKILSAENWTDCTKVLSGIMPLWLAQSNCAAGLVGIRTLDPGTYFFFLHLLIALGTSTQSDQAFAARIIQASTPSPEYPNDAFVNQLIYVCLMFLADPLGPYGWNNQQLQQFVQNLTDAITSTDPGSAAIKESLLRSQRVLNSDASYPMTDPYNPSIGLNVRQTDTLKALDLARASLRVS